MQAEDTSQSTESKRHSSLDAHVTFEGIGKEYGKETAVQSLDIAIRRGEFFSLLGPSGCGKTTTLRMLAGFVEPSRGKIQVSGRDITTVAPEARNIGVVFQDYAIFPHMTVFDNVAFGLRMRKRSKADVKGAVTSALERVGLRGSEAKYRKQLSGGQQQRVALARALVIEPDVLLLDEPLSALDLKLRDEMRGWIRSIQQTIGITTIYVTHDQTEALTMSDRIGVMRSGRLLQTGTPRELYDDPSDVQVASFLGTATLLEGAVQEAGPEFVSMTVAGRTLQGRVPTRADIRDQLLPGAACSLVLRAEQLDLVRDGGLHSVSSGMQELPCRVRVAAFEGPALSYATEVAGVDPDILVSAPARGGNAIFAAGESAVIRWPTAAAVVLPGRIHT